MTNALHQITLTYTPEEDRMLLRIGTSENTEYQFWLTRRFISVLWIAIVENLKKNPEIRPDMSSKVRDAMVAMSHQQAIQASDFSTQHTEKNENLTSDTGPLLVTGGGISQVSDTMTRLIFHTPNGGAFNISINQKLMHAFCHVILSTTETAGWNLGLSLGSHDANVIQPENNAVIH